MNRIVSPLNFVILLLALNIIDCSKILFLSLQQASHTNTQQNIVNEMVTRGHEVYIVLGNEFGTKYQARLIQDGVQILWYKQDTGRKYTGKNIDELFGNLLHNYSPKTNKETWDITVEIFHEECYDMFSDQKFLKAVKDLHVDLAVVDYWHAIPCNLLLPYNLSIPFVVQSVGILPWLIREAGLPSFVPWIIRKHSDKMTFWERVVNTYEHLYIYNIPTSARFNRTLIERHAPEMSNYNELLTQAQFYISMRDHMLEWPQPTMPNHIRLFGTTFAEPKPLRDDLKEIFETANNGIIILSFGSMGGKLPHIYVKKILQALKTFKQMVIFSFSGDQNKIGPIPQNIKIFPWIPQNDVLGHSKTKLFITHGGNNGQVESVYHGVPMITMPLYFDQFHNAFRVEEHGYGLTVNIYDFEPEDLRQAVKELLRNITYREAVKTASTIVKSQNHPAKKAADKIEHVIKFGGKHLKTSAFNMPFYQFLMLDILFLFIAVSIILCVFSYYLIKKCYLRYCKDQKKVKTKQN